jgi:hypothetical protein
MSMAGPASLLAAGSFARLFQALEGEWQLEKFMSDGSRFNGAARFGRLAKDCLRLTETGVLTLHDSRLQAGRTWDWFLRAGGQLEIRYPQEHGGAAYHLLTPVRLDDGRGADGWTGRASHQCAADVYGAEYRLGEDAIVIDHLVRGPKKDYRIEARMRR